jgi:hypothetical protein
MRMRRFWRGGLLVWTLLEEAGGWCKRGEMGGEWKGEVAWVREIR